MAKAFSHQLGTGAFATALKRFHQPINVLLQSINPLLMPSAQIPYVEMVALMALSDLEQLERPWLELMQSKDPESVAVAFRLALAHLTQTSKRLQMANVIQSVEQQGATAYKAVSHQ